MENKQKPKKWTVNFLPKYKHTRIHACPHWLWSLKHYKLLYVCYAPIATKLFSVWLRFHIETCMNWTLLTLSIKCGWMNSISKALKRIKSNYWPIIEEKTHFQCKTTAVAAAAVATTALCSIADIAVVFIVAVLVVAATKYIQ